MLRLSGKQYTSTKGKTVKARSVNVVISVMQIKATRNRQIFYAATYWERRFPEFAYLQQHQGDALFHLYCHL